MDESQQLAQLFVLIGVATFAEAAMALTTVNSTLDNAQATLGTKGTSATLSALVGRHARLAALEKAAGKAGDEADGLFRAALVSHTELPKAHAELAKLKQDGQSSELDKAIDKAKSASKLTKASEDSLRKAFSDGDVTLKGALAQLENMPVIPALAAAKDDAKPAVVEAAKLEEAYAPKHLGKKWGELVPQERADLKKSDPILYEAMRSTAPKA